MDFWRFDIPEHLSAPLESSYNVPLVLLSVVVASLAAFAALAVVERYVVLRRRDGQPQHHWLLIGAFVMGSGIWAMHFIAMLSMRMSGELTYAALPTLGSVLVRDQAEADLSYWVT